MKFRFVIVIVILFVIAPVLHAASRVTAYLWVTNYAVHSNSLTFNSADIRYASTNVTNSATQWPVTNTAAWTATNLLTHLANFPPLALASYSVLKSATNPAVLTIAAPASSNLTVVPTGSGGSNWAWVRYETNVSATATNFVIPAAAVTNTMWSNIVSGLVEWLNKSPRSGEKVSNSAPIFADFADTTSAETLSNKTLIFVVLDGTGQLRNVGISNAFLTNVVIVSGTVTGSLFTITGDGLGTWATIKSSSSTAALGPSILFHREDGTTNAVSLNDVLGHLIFSGWGTTGLKAGARIRAYADETFTDTSAMSSLTFEVATNGSISPVVKMRVNAAGVTVSNGVFRVLTRGEFSSLIATQLQVLGSAAISGDLSVTGAVSVAGAATLASSLSVTGAVNAVGGAHIPTLSLTRVSTNLGALLLRPATNTTLAAGNNIVDRQTNNVIYFAPTAGAAVINAITNGFGDGDWFWGINGTTFTLTLTNESGFTSIPNTRLTTVNGVGGVTVQPGGMFLVYYSAQNGRWLVLYPEYVTAYQPASTALTNLAGAGAAVVTNSALFAPSTNAHGDLWFDHLSNTNAGSNVWITVANTFVPLTNWTINLANLTSSQGSTNLLTAANSAGVFDVSYTVEDLPIEMQDLKWAVFTNGIIASNLFSIHSTNAGWAAKTSRVYLPTNSTVDLRCSAAAITTNKVKRATLAIARRSL